MSSRRNRSRDQHGAFDHLEADTESVANNIFGDSLKGIKAPETITYIPIMEITPDPTQPRRAMPSVVRAGWDKTPQTLSEAFGLWHDLVEQERGGEFDVMHYLDTVEIERAEMVGPLEESFIHLITLAGSIKRDGLTNPITLVRDGTGYQLETGERRWLAYHLLASAFEGDDWNTIPSRVMSEFSHWRQAAENTARDDLNAIGKARQLALLLMDLHGRQNFKSYDDLVQSGECDRTFYAQVADGNEWRIPRGRSELLLQATGLKSASQIRDYRALLRLPDDVWTLADDGNLTEYEIRTKIYTVASETVSPQNQSPKKSKPRAKPLSTKAAMTTIDTFHTRNGIEALRQLERKKRLKYAELYRQWAEMLEEDG